MYKSKKNKKNKRNIFSIVAAIGLTILFAGVGVRIFGTSEEQAEKNNKSFFAFAELDKHMAEFEGETFKEKTGEMRQEFLEERTEEIIQQTFVDKTEETEQETFENKENEAGQEGSEGKEEKTGEESFEGKTDEIKQTEQLTTEISETQGNQNIVLGTEYTFTDAPQGYFEDALFIGDSRTVDLEEYGKLEGADFFAVVGMSVYNITGQRVDVAGEKNIDIETLLSNHSYGKIYFMLGLNELGYNRQKTVDRYRGWVEHIRQMQPQAIIFIEANLHVTAQKSASNEECRNEDIDEFNNYTKELADNRTIFYVDVNELFDDEGGNLRSDLTYDGVHILAKYYADWGEWLRKKAIIR